MFSIEKATGKQCYMLSAKELSIAWGSSPLYWSWRPALDSRFAEVAELRTIWWLEIIGRINNGMLSPATTYGAYLIVQIADRAYGLDYLASEVSVSVGNFKSERNVYIRPHDSKRKGKAPVSGPVLWEREDGWTEIELGSFYNEGGNNEEVTVCLKEVKGVHLKGGLIVQGIEIRPKQIFKG
ncbi:F-box protein [Quillaja saponaria]|uniref:F-box protein n=1 Tax=Quillaja saponaria TaxID=32244 RepID=A0AAD7VJD7_QUISA|nr:F-box protein [Quillaja saponaria]